MPSSATSITKPAYLDIIEPQKILHFPQRHRALQVRLVIKNQQGGAHQLLLFQQLVQLVSTHDQPLLVRRVDDPDQSVCFFEEISPVGSDGLLAADVPKGEFVALEIKGFYLEAEGRADGIDVFVVELFDDCCLA